MLPLLFKFLRQAGWWTVLLAKNTILIYRANTTRIRKSQSNNNKKHRSANQYGGTPCLHFCKNGCYNRRQKNANMSARIKCFFPIIHYHLVLEVSILYKLTLVFSDGNGGAVTTSLSCS